MKDKRSDRVRDDALIKASWLLHGARSACELIGRRTPNVSQSVLLVYPARMIEGRRELASLRLVSTLVCALRLRSLRREPPCRASRRGRVSEHASQDGRPTRCYRTVGARMGMAPSAYSRSRTKPRVQVIVMGFRVIARADQHGIHRPDW